jgi:hypothetical protein
MDPKTHQRFLDYLESYEYFRRPGVTKLGREEWMQLDAEMRALVTKEKAKTLGAADAKRLRELRARLYRD